jgi:hypothetical protein
LKSAKYDRALRDWGSIKHPNPGFSYNYWSEDEMENWKKALLAGSAAMAVIMLLKGNKTAGLIAGGVGLATLASEYPEKFAEIRENLPEYIERGTTYLDVVSRVGERLAEAAESRGSNWYEALLAR